jgi:hypothetical protein
MRICEMCFKQSTDVKEYKVCCGYNFDTTDEFEIMAAIQLAFEAGKWAGQVETEEFYDNEQYSTAIQEVIESRNTCLPTNKTSSGRTVMINLRSNEWREGVRKSADDYKAKALEMLISKKSTSKNQPKQREMF